MPDIREVITITEVDTSRPNKVGVKDHENRWFGVFDQQLWPRLKEGASLNIEWKAAGEGGKYRNITAILGSTATSNGSTPTSKEANIMRECALKAAVDFCSPAPWSSETIEQCLFTAEKFLAWLKNEEKDDEVPF